jgi:hypothetical protein
MMLGEWRREVEGGDGVFLGVVRKGRGWREQYKSKLQKHNINNFVLPFTYE